MLYMKNSMNKIWSEQEMYTGNLLMATTLTLVSGTLCWENVSGTCICVVYAPFQIVY